MYYSSESEEDLHVVDSSHLDFSYLMMDAESLSLHLRNSIMEQEEKEVMNVKEKYPLSASSASAYSSAKQQQQQQHLQCDITRSRRTLYDKSDLEKFSDENINEFADYSHDKVTTRLLLQHNMLLTLPFELVRFSKLRSLDLSNNSLNHINDFLLQLPELQNLYLKNNHLGDDGLPKDMSVLTKLRELNLSGNNMTTVPNQLYEMTNLRYLYLGNNQITEILPEVNSMQSLHVLHLGGNLLEDVPDELGELHQLQALILCENHLRRLPRSIASLTRLRTLLLHKNNLCCLPVGIVKLRGLLELSLRDNPLVTKFVNSCARELMYNSPTLLELAARVINLKKLQYTKEDLPKSLIHYLNSGHRCVNPKCKGMYFASCVEHIKFVDFCGMYRVPLMHYLCSSRCSSKTPSYYSAAATESESEEEEPSARMRKVLLPNLPI